MYTKKLAVAPNITGAGFFFQLISFIADCTVLSDANFSCGSHGFLDG